MAYMLVGYCRQVAESTSIKPSLMSLDIGDLIKKTSIIKKILQFKALVVLVLGNQLIILNNISFENPHELIP